MNRHSTVCTAAYRKEFPKDCHRFVLSSRFLKFTAALVPNQILPCATSRVVLVAAVTIQNRGKMENRDQKVRKM